MKKQIFGVLTAVTVCALVGFNIALNVKTNKLSDIALASIEATASTEGNKKYTQNVGEYCEIRDVNDHYIDWGYWHSCEEKEGEGCLTGCIVTHD